MAKNSELTQKIRECLRKYYLGKNDYLLFEEVKRSSGYIKPERFADAIVVSMFPSNGIGLMGFEIKTTREDLLSELRDLSKAEAFKQFCDYWILIVPSQYRHGEILKGRIKVPDDWGIWEWFNYEDSEYEDGENGFHVKRKPKQLYPKPVDRYFLASLLRQPATNRMAE